LTFTAVALPGRDDPSTDLAARLGPVGVNHSEQNVLSFAQDDHTTLAVVAARIRSLQRRAIEDLRGEREIESALPEIPIALASVPGEAHSESIRLYIQCRKSRWRANGLRLTCGAARPLRLR